MKISIHPIAHPECRLPFVNVPTIFLEEQRCLAAMNISDEGRDSRIFLVNVDTLESEFVSVPDAQWGPYGFVKGADGKIYVGFFFGRIYSFDPASKKFELKADPFANQTPDRLTWGGYASRAGRLYMGVYPTGEFTEYEIATGEFRTIAPLEGVPFGVYANQFVELPDGRILVFLYGSQAGIFIYNPATRRIEARREITDLAFQSKNRSLSLLDEQRAIYASDQAIRVFNFQTLDWEADFLAETPDKLTWIRCFNGRFYGVGNGEGHVFEISRSGCRRVETGLHTGNRVMGGIHQIGPDLFACLGDNGLFAKFSLTRGPVETVQVDNHTTTGMNIYTLRKDPCSSQAVGSHFINSQIFHLDLATGVSRSSLNRIVTTPGQITCVTFLDGVVYLAVYGYAILQAYRPDEPFAFGNNPRTIMRIGCEQHRPVGLLNDGKSLFMATRADYGKLGGAISVINPADGACEVFRDFVPTQNPVSLFLHQGLLIGTTEIYGDQGSCLPKASCAVIFAWSIDQRATVHTFSPWECKSLRALGISPSGTMIGFGSGKYFLYDSSTKTCTVHPWEGNDPGSGVFLDSQRFLTVVPAGKGRNQVMLLNVETQAVETVEETEGLRLFELLDSGEILAAVEGATVAKVRLHDL